MLEVDALASAERNELACKPKATEQQVADGAIPLWMPRLFAADAIEARVASFVAARDGQTNPPLGIFDRSRVNTWLRAMDEQFAGISSWMP